MIKAFTFLASVWAGGAFACGDVGVPLNSRNENAPHAVQITDGMPLSQPFSITIQFCEDAVNSEIRLNAVMPAHQHGMNYTPNVIDLGGGAFRADGMLFHMPGIWEIQVQLIRETEVFRYTNTVTAQ